MKVKLNVLLIVISKRLKA